MIDPNPCQDCTERNTACHDHCERYKGWVEQYHAQLKHLKDQRASWYIPGSVARDKLRNRYNSGQMRAQKGGEK
jgi:hypothetical protein